MRYVIITLEEAKTISERAGGSFAERMREEIGANIQEIVDLLSGQAICRACRIEGQSASCESIQARALGRRLRRLLERARTQTPGDPAKDEGSAEG